MPLSHGEMKRCFDFGRAAVAPSSGAFMHLHDSAPFLKDQCVKISRKATQKKT